MVNPLALVSGLLAITCFLLALFILKVGRLRLHRLWAFFNISVGIWGTGICLAALSKSQENAFRFWQFAHSGGFFVGVIFYHVVHNFCDLKGKKFLFFAYAQAIFFSILNLIGITGYEVVPTFGPLYYVKVHDILYVAITILWFLPVIYGHAILFKALHSTTGKKRVQIKYLLVSMFIGFSGGIQHFLPVYDINVYPYGNLLITLYTLVATYAIFKHKLLDIEVIIKRTLVFAGLFAMSMTTIAIVTTVLQFFALSVPASLYTALSTMLVIAFYDPTRKFLIEITDRFLFQKKFNYRLFLKEASREMAAIKSLNKLSKVVVAFLIRKARIRNAAVFAEIPKQHHYLLKASRPHYRGVFSELSIDHPLILLLKEIERPIDLEEVINRMATARDPEEKEKYSKIIKLMESFDSHAVVPSFFYLEKRVSRAVKRAIKNEPNLRSLLFLGPKKSDEPYGGEDLDVFYTLAQESAIAIENARLYDEAVERRKEAEERRREAEESAQAAERSRQETLEAMRKIEEMEAELVRRERLLFVQQLVQGLGHEINNPVQTISLRLSAIDNKFLSILQVFDDLKQYLSEEKRNDLYEKFAFLQKGFSMINLGINHVNRIVDTLAQIQYKDDKSITLIDFKAFWKITYPMLQMETHGGPRVDIPVAFESPQFLPPILGNTTQLTQVFINLFRNAARAMENIPEKIVRIHADRDHADEKILKVTFSDNGCGMSQDILDRMFDFGFTTKAEKGHGIGLNQCKLIIERVFEGTLKCESELGKGTTFIIRIPFAKEAGDQNLNEYRDLMDSSTSDDSSTKLDN